jgi:SAM-dependent methyltransferase
VIEILRAMKDDVKLVAPSLATWWLHHLKHSEGRYLDILSFFRPSERGGDILEVGAVPGQFTVLLKELGYRVRGVDLDPDRVGGLWSKYGLEVDRVDIEQEPLPFASGSFDLVLFTETLEHLRLNPLLALREIHRVLRPGGRMILSTNHITPVHRLKFFLGRPYHANALDEFRKLEELGHMGHFRIYQWDEVRSFCEFVGFDISQRAYRGPVLLGRKAGAVLSLLPGSVRDNFRHSVYAIAEKS